MFGYCKVTPSFREFTKKELSKTYEKWDSDINSYVFDTVVLSDCDLMDIFAKKYCNGYRFSAIAKKLESFRKKLWRLKKEGFIEEVRRTKILIQGTKGNFTSDEIFYKLR